MCGDINGRAHDSSCMERYLDGEQVNCRVKAIESQKGRDEKEPWVRYRRQG
jgi:hypothetical protein